jgi:hypothetical protein
MGVALLREAHGFDNAGPMFLLFRIMGSDHSNARMSGAATDGDKSPIPAKPSLRDTGRLAPYRFCLLPSIAPRVEIPDGSRRAASVGSAHRLFSRSSDASSNG